MTLWGESTELLPVKEISIGDIILCKINSQHYQKGTITSLDGKYKNIFGHEINGILVSFNNESYSFNIITEKYQLRHNQETLKENRSRKISEAIS